MKYLLLLTLIILSGCESLQDHTPTEKVMFGALVAGQTADLVSTQRFLDRGFHERNPLYGDDINKVLIGKIVATGLMYGLGQLDPGRRVWYYTVGSVIGVGAAIHNEGL